MLTNRKFSIDIRHPCPLSKVFEPREVTWDTKIECYDYPSDDNLAKDQNFSIVLANKMNNFDYLTEFKNLNLTEYFHNVNLLVLKANLDYIQPISENVGLKQNLLALGIVPNIENFKMAFIFRKVYHKMFKLTPELEKKFNNFKQKIKLNGNKKLFCVQIRIGGARPNVGSDRVFTERKYSKLYWKFMKHSIIKNESNYKIFITSDTESVTKEAIAEFGRDKVLINEGAYYHLDLGPSSSYSCKHHEKTFLDLHTFQLCDKVVISRGGYGLMGNFLREDPFNEFYRYTDLSNEISFIQINNIKDLEENLQNEINWVKSIS